MKRTYFVLERNLLLNRIHTITLSSSNNSESSIKCLVDREIRSNL